MLFSPDNMMEDYSQEKNRKEKTTIYGFFNFHRLHNKRRTMSRGGLTRSFDLEIKTTRFWEKLAYATTRRTNPGTTRLAWGTRPILHGGPTRQTWTISNVYWSGCAEWGRKPCLSWCSTIDGFDPSPYSPTGYHMNYCNERVRTFFRDSFLF